MNNVLKFGAIAQLVEHLHGMQGSAVRVLVSGLLVIPISLNETTQEYTMYFSV